MYPSGVGSNFMDPRRTNFTKTQTLNMKNGQSAIKDFAETTANVAPHPTDVLGTNLRRGKGLSFSKGIAQFDGFVRGQGVNSSGMAPPGPEPDSSTGRPGSSRPQSGRASFRPQSGRQSEAEASQLYSSRMNSATSRNDQGERPPSARPSSSRFRPHSAPAKRPQEELPMWARDQIVGPTWAKTVDNQKRPSSSKFRPSSGLPLSSIPKWISLDKKMLSFEAFFKEAVQESPIERYRVRRCIIQYFLEDDTLKISEPREENSGIPQGSFLKRHKVPKDGGGFLTWQDLKVPGDLHLYRRTFRVTKCDDFTKQFYERAGFKVGEEELVPMDEVHQARSRPSSAVTMKSTWDGNRMEYHGRQRNDMSEYIEARLGKCQDKKALVTKYLDNDRKVLRFYCAWDEKSPDGIVEKRPFVLHFFLADDTVEVLEVNRPNSGRDPFPALLKRMKLPKENKDPGVTAGGSVGKPVYYSAHDLFVGAVVSVFGRQMVLNDCDESTARYYKEEFGIDFNDRRGKMYEKPNRPRSAVMVPPHNGFGKEEDTRQNCLSLHPKPPKVNVIRLLENKGKVLRFVGKLENAVGFDIERVFTITYFMDTDELAIFEPPVKNSGRTGGKFMERCKVRKPRSNEYYAEADLYLGARVHVYSRRFVLVDADEYTIKYMESNPAVYPFSDMEAILSKLEDADTNDVDQKLRGKDKLGKGSVNVQDFKWAIMSSNLGLNDQEAHTLCRYLGDASNKKVQYEKLTSGELTQSNRLSMAVQPTQTQMALDPVAQDGLAKLRSLLFRRGPAGLRGLERAMQHISRGATVIDRADFDTVLGFCGVSLHDSEVTEVFNSMDRGDGVIECADLTNALRVPLSPAQHAAVADLFEILEDPTFRTGAVDLEEVTARYKPGRHPRVQSGEMSEGEAMRELEEGLEGVNGAVMLKDLAALYADIVQGYKLDDALFIDLLRATWGLSGRR